MKYLIVDAPGGEVPVLFPRGFMHRYMADRLAPLPVVAAGFVKNVDGQLACFGHSTGLKLGSRPERDSELLRIALADGVCPG
ncbi:MAG: hypothetical protein H6905_10785 [Hyphomicrobiales bacterium]|nr:hypothetical protein [Hyphomicrobiales bacterium]